MYTLFSVVQSITKDFLAFFSIRSRRGVVRLVMLAVAAIAAVTYTVLSESSTKDDPVTPAQTTVTVQSVNSFNDTAAIELIGTVRAISEAEIASEAGGRVTAVPVSLGSEVAVGTVLARLENSAQYAALLQAEGAYEAALAAAEISNVSVAEAIRGQETANTAARNALLSVKNTLDTLFYSRLDDIYADPENTYRTPGFLGEDAPLIYSLRDDYTYFETQLTSWNTNINQAATAAEYLDLLSEMYSDVNRMSTFVQTFRTLITDDNRKDESFNTTANSYLASLGEVDSQLAAAISSITTAETSIKQAQDTLTRAQLGGTTGTASAANAQIKQALGSLRAAQSAYNKTIITAPITGQITALPINVGEYVGSLAVVAKITNASAYEVTTYVTETTAAVLQIGTEVILEDDIVGTVSSISSAISSDTARREMKIQSTDTRLVSGETVRISIPSAAPEQTLSTGTTNTPTTLPLTAIKFQGSDAFVFTVNDASELEQHPVELGRTQGSQINVTAGITQTMEIVVDARGLSAGQGVVVN